MEVQLDVVQQRLVRGLLLGLERRLELGQLLELELELVLELELRLDGPRWHRRNRQRL